MTGNGRTLAPGATFDRYTIEALLGEGGMGQVYRASDNKLQRRVALKLLRVSDADPSASLGRARLLREARAVAGLDHPNAISVFDVGEIEDTPYIAMELVEGRPLRRLIGDPTIPIEARVRWLCEIGRALAAAHARNIVHRDIKPENVMVRSDGVVKVLDFGIARRAAPEVSPLGATDGPGAMLVTLTATGGVIGTPRYMSPEQMRGEPLDGRSDQFAWGLVAYELLSGAAPWPGADALAIVSQILSVEAPALVVPDCPEAIPAIVLRALSKRPDARFSSMDDLVAALEAAVGQRHLPIAPAAATPALALPAAPARPARWPVALLLLALPLVGGLAYRLAGRGAPAPGPTPAAGSAQPFSRIVELTKEDGSEIHPSLSPDGSWFVYAARVGGKWDLLRRRVGGDNPQNITADCPDDDDRDPAISPDGERIAFRSDRAGGGIFVMGATGESVKQVTDFGYDPSWSPDGKELVVGTWPTSTDRPSTQSIWRVRVESGEKRRLYPRKEGELLDSFGAPKWSPHGDRIAWTGEFGRAIQTALPDGAGLVSTLKDLDGFYPLWSPTGDALWYTGTFGGTPGLWRAPVDEVTGRSVGPPALMLSGLGKFIEAGSFARNGNRLVFTLWSARSVIERIAFDAAREAISGSSVRVVDGVGPLVRGSELVFSSEGQIYATSLEGSARRQLTEQFFNVPTSWSADGRELYYYTRDQEGVSVWAMRRDGSKKRRLFPSISYYPAAAPDGKRIMIGTPDGARIHSLEPGAAPLEVLPAPDGPGTNFNPRRWSRDGSAIAGTIDHRDGGERGLAIWSTTARSYAIVSRTGMGGEWLKDSRRLLFTDGSRIVLYDTGTRQRKTILTVQGGVGEILSLDEENRLLYFTHWFNEASIWLAEVVAEAPRASGP